MAVLDMKKVENNIEQAILYNTLGLDRSKYTLAIVSVGSNPASELYIKNKKKVIKSFGFEYKVVKINDDENFDTSEEKKEYLTKIIKEEIDILNNDIYVAGIIVQLPLPSILSDSEEYIINLISPKKDIDGLTKNSSFVPCTPLGIYEIMKATYRDLHRKNVTIVGRGKLVGEPLVDLLLGKVASVVSLSSKSSYNITSLNIAHCDILITCVGNGNFDIALYDSDIHAIYEDFDFTKLVIDAGINRVDGVQYGDTRMDSSEYKNKRVLYTPRIGGVGKITCFALCLNLSIAIKKSRSEKGLPYER